MRLAKDVQIFNLVPSNLNALFVLSWLVGRQGRTTERRLTLEQRPTLPKDS